MAYKKKFQIGEYVYLHKPEYDFAGMLGRVGPVTVIKRAESDFPINVRLDGKEYAVNLGEIRKATPAEILEHKLIGL